MLSLSADHVAAFTVWPRSAGETTVLCDFLFHPAELARPDFDPSDAAGFWDLVNRQDWSICEQVQDGWAPPVLGRLPGPDGAAQRGHRPVRDHPAGHDDR